VFRTALLRFVECYDHMVVKTTNSHNPKGIIRTIQLLVEHANENLIIFFCLV
jgi:hypothetical protein